MSVVAYDMVDEEMRSVVRKTVRECYEVLMFEVCMDLWSDDLLKQVMHKEFKDVVYNAYVMESSMQATLVKVMKEIAG